jgi:glycosyltransferase involved in cell wall biosynthesis
MTNVLYLITELDVGGAERILFDLVTHLDRAKYNPAVACLTGHGDVGRMLEKAGVPVHYLDMRGKYDLRLLFTLPRLLRELNIQILHTFLYHANITGGLAGRRAGVPVRIASVHMLEFRRGRLFGERRSGRRFDRVVCVSRTVREHMLDKGRIPDEKLVLIPNGIDLKRFAVPRPDQVRTSIREELNIPLDAPVFITVARFHPEKGPEDLVEVIRLILSNEQTAHFVVVGDGWQGDEAEELTFSLSELSERVHFTGVRQDVPRLLTAADVFVFTSPCEGLGLAVLEAMAAGVPVAAFDVPGIREAAGEYAALVEYGDCAALADSAIKLARDPASARALIEGAHRRVRDEFSLEKMVAQTAQLYETLLREKKIV